MLCSGQKIGKRLCAREGEQRGASLGAGRHEALTPEAREMCRHGALGEPEMFRQLDHTMLAEPQVVEYREPRRIAKATEECSGPRNIVIRVTAGHTSMIEAGATRLI